MTQQETELADVRQLRAMNVIDQAEYEKRMLAIARRYAMAEPAAEAAAPAAAAAAAAAPVSHVPTMSARDFAMLSDEERKGLAQEKGAGIKPQPLPQPCDKKTGAPIVASLSSVKIRAAEDGRMIEEKYFDSRSQMTKTKKVYVGNGKPTGRIVIDVNLHSKLSLTYLEFLQFAAKFKEIEKEVEGLVTDCQPRVVPM